jgi:hypothetical protein
VHWNHRLLRRDKGRRIGKECVFETEDLFLIGGFKSIGIIDFCEVTNEDVLETEAIGFIIGNL